MMLSWTSEMRTITLLLIISLIVAIAGCAQPSFFPWPDDGIRMAIRTFAPAAVWAVLFAVGLITHGRRGLWLLVGAPFALFWPAVWTMYVAGCTLGDAPC